MKKVLLLFVLSVFMFGCSGSSPKVAAEKFLTALSKGDYDEAKKYCTYETSSMIDFMQSIAPDDAKNENFKFKFIREEIDGDKAIVYYENENGEEDKVDLAKEDGKWRVHIIK